MVTDTYSWLTMIKASGFGYSKQFHLHTQRFVRQFCSLNLKMSPPPLQHALISGSFSHYPKIEGRKSHPDPNGKPMVERSENYLVFPFHDCIYDLVRNQFGAHSVFCRRIHLSVLAPIACKPQHFKASVCEIADDALSVDEIYTLIRSLCLNLGREKMSFDA